jgi:hypothetical protein
VKTLLKLIVVLIVINGAYHFGMSEYRYSEFTDGTHAILAVGASTPVDQVKEQILKKAADLNLPVLPDRVEVTRGIPTNRTSVKVSYHTDIEVFPGYKYPRDYSFTDEITALR